MSQAASWALTVNLSATLLMTGVIWVIQLVHYPLFDAVDRETYADFQRRHVTRITWVVAPLMLVELASAVALWRLAPAALRGPALAGLALLALIWGSTVVLQGRQHAVLSKGFDRAVHRRLVATNWIRTAAWSARGALLLRIAGHAPG